MDQFERFRKTDEVLAKFKNGKELYQNSALFNQSVQILVRGLDPYDLIEQLIQVTADTQSALEQRMIRERPIMYMKDI